MEIGIIGLPQSGKKTVFNLLTGGSNAAENTSQKAKKDIAVGISKIHDERLYALAKVYNPPKITPATIQYIVLPKLSKDSENNRDAFKSIATVDALCHVVRAFSDETVFHIDGTINAVRDIEFVESELLLNDLLFTETRIERLKNDNKRKNDPGTKKEINLMEHILERLNNEIPLRLVEFSDEEKKVLNAYPYLTRKNMLIVLNIDEDKVSSTELLTTVTAKFSDKGMHVAQVSARIEMELAEIEDAAEKQAFLKDLGIERSALEKVTRLSYEALGLLSFFTAGDNEVRAWTIRKGLLAPQAGGAVHSDIERGFIRAEHMRIEDLLELGSEAKVKEAGKFSLKGKDYLVQDGDVLFFRFNV